MDYTTQLFQSIIDKIGAATLVLNREAAVVACNKDAEKLLQAPLQSLHGRRLSELELTLLDRDRMVVKDANYPLTEILPRNGGGDDSKFILGLQFPPLKEVVWCQAVMRPDYSHKGELNSVFLTLTDLGELPRGADNNINRLDQLEQIQQIVLAKKEWETTVDALDDIVTIQDRDMGIVRANKAAHDLFGYELGELKGKKCYEVFHNRSIPCEHCPVSETGLDSCAHTGTIYNKVLDKTFSVSSFPLTDQTGQVHQYVQMARDVTQYLRNQSEKNRLMAAIEQTSESVVISDQFGTIQYVNPSFEASSGYTKDEVIGQNANILKSGVHDRQFYMSMWKTLADKMVWRGRLTNRRKNGNLFKEDVTISPVLGADGNIINYVALKRDITREELLEQQLHQGMKMEALGTLAGGIAHDFNNILSAMIGYGEIAKGRLPGDHPARKDIEQVIAGGDRAVDLVKQILTFSRQESYGQFRRFKLQYIIKEVIKLLRPSLPATIELKSEISPSCSPILADPGQIYQVLMNLCTNAKQSIGAEHGCITIKLSEMKVTEDCVSAAAENSSGVILDLEVSDSGCGIEQDKLDKIFDPFFTTKEKGQGTGLGLAVVHGIIKKHKGEIQVSSKVGVGTSFHIYLAADVGEEEEVRKGETAGPGGKERIMVVDDEKLLVKMLKDMLTKAGYQVITFDDSIEAVKEFRENPYCCDLVITDMVMPNMTGAELSREFLGQRSDIPIIMLTGYSENFDRIRAQKMGIKTFLLKPVRKNTLYQTIRKVLEDGKNIDH